MHCCVTVVSLYYNYQYNHHCHKQLLSMILFVYVQISV